MEKIYMNDDRKKKKQTFFKKFFNDKGSMVATIIVAIVGIAGLVAFGFNQISFAAGDKTGASLPDEFVTGQGENTTRIYGESSSSGEGSILPVLGFHGIIDDDGTRIPVFCIEYNIPFQPGIDYSKGPEITDQGLIYLMSQMYPNKPFVDESGNEYEEMVQVWATQAALWSYLYEVGDANNSKFVEWNDKVKNVDKLFIGDEMVTPAVSTPGTTIFEKFGLNKLIAQAKQYRTTPFVHLNVNKASDTISITNDNKYYQSDLVSVVGSTSSPLINSFESYSVTLKNAPSGTILVDESGNVYDNIANMSPASKFYVRVPVDKVTDETKNIEINIRGNFKMYGANSYSAPGYQKVINVGILNRSEDKPLSIQLDYTPDVPDTGMSAAQTIYFIGLIVLLSGVGIIYVNAKPEKNN